MATGGNQESTCLVEDVDSVGGKLPVMCDPCGRRKKTTPAAVVCSTCDVKLCRGCREVHSAHVPGEHVFVAIGDVTLETGLVDMHGLDRCSSHNRKFRYVCRNHESLCCDDCHFDDHKTCKDVHKLKTMATGADISLPASVEKVQRVISSAKEVIDKCDMLVQGGEERRNEIISALDRKKEEIIKSFDDTKRQIIEDLDVDISSDKIRLDDVKRGAESVQMNLRSLMSFNEAVSKDGTDVEKFVLDFTCKQKAALGSAKLTEMRNDNYTVQHTLEWNDHVLTLLNEPLVSLRYTQLPSTMDSSVDNDPDDGNIIKDFIEIHLLVYRSTDNIFENNNCMSAYTIVKCYNRSGVWCAYVLPECLRIFILIVLQNVDLHLMKTQGNIR